MRYLFILALVTAASPGWSATWHVEKDGTGDFSVIQDAVDAAASGDTIRIGPGRYDDGEVVTTLGWTEFVRVRVAQQDLTFIGAGVGETIVGREETWNLYRDGRDKCIYVPSAIESTQLRVSSITFENTREALTLDHYGSARISDCQFTGNDAAIVSLAGDTLTVCNSLFENGASMASFVGIWGMNSISVSHCFFNMSNAISKSGVYINGVLDARIANCSFVYGHSGVKNSACDDLIVTDCIFERQSGASLYSTDSHSRVSIDRCRFDKAYSGILFDASLGWIRIEQTGFTDMVTTALTYRRANNGYIRNCNIQKGLKFAVKWDSANLEHPPDPVHFDMRNNWWGTTNPDSISVWIEDHHDNPDNMFIIDFEPFAETSVANQPKSLGGLKALYR